MSIISSLEHKDILVNSIPLIFKDLVLQSPMQQTFYQDKNEFFLQIDIIKIELLEFEMESLKKLPVKSIMNEMLDYFETIQN